MSSFVRLGLSLLGGIALGSMYFLTLWWMVQKLVGGRGAHVWIVASVVVRVVLVLGVFVPAVFWGGWPALLAALGGFVIARMVLIRWLPAPVRGSGSVA